VATSPEPRARKNGGKTEAGWLAAVASIPRYVLQPFSLSAVAVVAAALLGIFGAGLAAALAALAASVLLLVIGLRGTPRAAIGSLVAGGTYQQVSDISVTTPVGKSGLTDRKGARLAPLEAICFLHLYVLKGGSVGRTRVFLVDYFVDLMTAALVPSHLECMTRELTEHVRRSGRMDGVTTMACPKRGNALLLAAVARELQVEPLFVKERPLFGKILEGIGGSPKRAALLDDVSSDGELLVSCVAKLRECGYAVADAFVLVDRPEGDAPEALAEVGVRLWPLYRFSDRDLEQLAARGRKIGPS